MKKASFGTKNQGFSLLEMAVVLVIAGLMVGMVNRTQTVVVEPSGCYAETKKQLATIHDAIVAFERKNQRLPVPAGRSLGSANPNFGRETNLATSLANIDRLSSGNNLLFGALPFQALGLSEYYAADCWGNKFSYVVTEKMTSSATSGGYPDVATVGGITLKSSGAVTVADASAGKGLSYVVTSHGETAVGAVKKNYSGASHGWCAAPTGAVAIDNENCDITNNTLVTANFNNGSTAGAAFYDDLVTFGGKLYTDQTVSIPAIYAWGANYGQGRIGDGGTDHRLKPVKVMLPGSAVPAAVYAGVAQSCALDTNGNAYCWGLNGDGNGGTLGNNTPPTSTSLVPVSVTMPAGVKFTKMALGHRHNCAIGNDGKAYCWGDNADAQGRGDGVTNLAWNKPTNPVTMPAGVKFVDIVARDNVNCALGDDGKAYCWGRGTNWSQVEGSNTNSRSQPFGITMPSGVTFTRIVGSYTSMCGVGTDKKYYCWGTNVHHQLGNNNAGTSAPALSFNGPVKQAASGSALTCAILDNNQTWCFGDDNNSYTGSGMYPTQFAMPGGVSYFTDIAIGGNSRCGLGNDFMVYCQGKNDTGQLGDGTSSDNMGGWSKADFTSLGVSKVTQVAGYGDHYVAIGQSVAGNLVCWGDNSKGQAPSTITGKFTQVGGGSRHTCALNAQGDLQCWGQYEDDRWGPPPANSPGPYIQLSVSKITATCMRRPNQDIHCLQDSYATIGYGEAPDVVTGPFIQLSEGYSHGCGLKQDGNVQCYGNNGEGQAPGLRTGPYAKISAGYYHTCGLKPNGDADCWGRNWNGQAPGTVTGPFTAIAASHTHTCAVRTNGNVKCWGDNTYGQAPASDVVGPFTEVAVGFEHTCAVRTNGNVKCWGHNTAGEVPASDVVGPLYALGAGRNHNCAIKATP